MHELSIAMSLVEGACEQVQNLDRVRVLSLRLRLGALSGVVREALEFSFDLAAEGTAVAGARLEIDEIPLTVFCPTCREERELPGIQHLRCPVCGTLTPQVVRGRELELFALEVVDVDPDALSPDPSPEPDPSPQEAGHAAAAADR
jgi:hydrogenase nickel incorporation protein HypA/HybF